MGSDVRIRWARRADAHAIGVLALEGLDDTPSSEVDLDDVVNDPRLFGEQLLEGTASILVAEEVDRGLVAGLRFVPREFVRASHAAEIALLVHPEARGRGVGTRLLRDALRVIEQEAHFNKLIMRVAADDVALAAVLGRASSRWVIERNERAALRREGRLIDMHLFALLYPR